MGINFQSRQAFVLTKCDGYNANMENCPSRKRLEAKMGFKLTMKFMFLCAQDKIQKCRQTNSKRPLSPPLIICSCSFAIYFNSKTIIIPTVRLNDEMDQQFTWQPDSQTVGNRPHHTSIVCYVSMLFVILRTYRYVLTAIGIKWIMK